MEQLFIHLASQSHVPHLKKMWMAPFHLQEQWIAQIKRLEAAARKGKETRLIAKMNSLTDEPIMDALVSAAQAGVKIDLIVRGACMLPAQLPGYTENIRIRSVIGRFLEHSRVFYFRSDDEEQLYLSSADWMNRNMLRRVELAWPITEPSLRQRIVEECLGAYLHDGVDAWQMQADGQYIPLRTKPGGHSAQRALMDRYRKTS
jgi:polyphosphate kinase